MSPEKKMTEPEELPTDEYLVKEVLSGKDEAFTELVRRHRQTVLNIIARYVRTLYELDDICQEIFIKVYQNLREYHGDGPFQHWVSTIAVNTCYNLFREQRCGGIDAPPEHDAFVTDESACKDIPDKKD